MKELGVDLAEVRTFFSEEHGEKYVLVTMAAERVQEWTNMLGVPARRCYIADDRLRKIVEENGHTHEAVVEALIPDVGSVMSGDYGEIMTALYLASLVHPEEVLEPKMWRLKSRRTKASEGSDVVQFQLPEWPASTSDDKVVCAEVKTKSTNGSSTPVKSAIADSIKDRKSRLSKTLVWLRERAILGDLTTVDLNHLNRFINATDHPQASFDFRAVAVVSSELVDLETSDEVFSEISLPPRDECVLIVISVPELKANYEKLYKSLVAISAFEVRAP